MADAKLVACCPFAKWEALLIERYSFYHIAVAPGTLPVNSIETMPACCVLYLCVKIEKNQRNLFEKSGNGQLLFPSAERVVPCERPHLLPGAKNGTASQRGACCTIFCGRRSTRARIHCFFHGFERVVPHIVWQAQLKDLLMAGAKLAACFPAKWEAQFHGETHVLIEIVAFTIARCQRVLHLCIR